MGTPRLYTDFRSGAAQRVRIGLSLKGVPYESVPVHLVRNGGEHLFPSFKALNPVRSTTHRLGKTMKPFA